MRIVPDTYKTQPRTHLDWGLSRDMSHVVVDAVLLFNHTVSHIEPVEEDTCNPKGDLGQVEKNSGLIYEVDTLRAS